MANEEMRLPPISTAEASQETIERATQKLRAIIESRKARAARK